MKLKDISVGDFIKDNQSNRIYKIVYIWVDPNNQWDNRVVVQDDNNCQPPRILLSRTLVFFSSHSSMRVLV